MKTLTIELSEEDEEDLQKICNHYKISESEFAQHVITNFFELMDGFEDIDDIRQADKALEEMEKHPQKTISHEEVCREVLDNAD